MRVKRGVTKQRRHKKILDLASGYRMSYHKLYRRAKEAVLHAGQYSYAHRRRRGSQMREEWIKVISAGLSSHNISYSKFVKALSTNNIELDRKSIAYMIVKNPKHFEQLVKSVA